MRDPRATARAPAVVGEDIHRRDAGASAGAPVGQSRRSSQAAGPWRPPPTLRSRPALFPGPRRGKGFRASRAPGATRGSGAWRRPVGFVSKKFIFPPRPPYVIRVRSIWASGMPLSSTGPSRRRSPDTPALPAPITAAARTPGVIAGRDAAKRSRAAATIAMRASLLHCRWNSSPVTGIPPKPPSASRSCPAIVAGGGLKFP